MPTAMLDVLCLGNAIVDLLCMVEEDFLLAQGVTKGSMTLIDEPRAEQLHRDMGQVIVKSGGSGANTAVGVASFGARAAFIGKVKQDDVGSFFTRDIRDTGVTFTTAHATEGAATARSFILVTPDGQRSMNTFLGACQGLTEADVDPDLVRGSAITYLEGYLWDPPAAKTAFKKAAALAHAAGRKVAITLSDSFCVDRYRAEFLDLIRSKTVDIVFSNESELHALYQTSDFNTAVAALRADCALAAVTLGAAGASVLTPDAIVSVPAVPIANLVDTTGAGDLFASGFLAGLSRGADHETCARLGTLAAAEIIQHVGARPAKTLKHLADQNGLRY